MSDRIIIKDLLIFARHGALAAEAALGQRFAIDIEACLDLAPAGRADDLSLTISYVDLIRVATDTLTHRRYNLIEAAAEAVAAAMLAAFPTISAVSLELRKPGAPIDAVFAHVAVSISRARSLG